MLILLGILLGNLSAIAVNAFAWHWRRKCLWHLVGFGLGVFLCFGFSVYITWADIRMFAQGDDWAYYHIWSKLRNFYVYWGWNAVLLLLFCFVAWLQSRQIPSYWWKAFLALWGEIGLWMFALSAGVFLLGDMPELGSAFPIAFLITTAVLTLLRPVCLRWARPIWQVVNEMRTRKS